MGNTHIKPHPRQRNKKQVHWKAAARPHSPGKPFLVSEVEPTPDLVSIRWTKPTSDGGSPISGYLIEHRRTGSPHWVRATPLLVQLPELTISGLEPGWRYQFRVSAENAVGISDPSDLSEPITVTLQRSAVTAPRITQDLQDTNALENEKAEFVVHFLGQPPPKVCWYKDAFEIFSSRRIRILTENDRSVLTIHQCSLSDEGEIKCTATNRAGHVSTKSKLVVSAPPSVRLPRQYEDGLLFEIGELIRLKVSVAGRPTPLVFWCHNGESIKNNDRYEIEYADNSSVLKITDAQREDRGEYVVKAVNKLGEHIQSFLVTVTDKPSPPGRARVVMALGRSVTLSWNLPHDDGGCKIGNYIVEYYRLGWDVWLKAATSRQLTTMLGDLIEGSEYKFRIKAESPYGVSEPSEESEVVFIPDTKRGILQPPARSKSQTREVIQPPVTPIARRKNKQRSLSSPRVEQNQPYIPTTVPVEHNVPPKRPMRTKIKSPSKTPEASPLPTRKDLNSQATKREIETKLNNEIFERSDSSSMARDLAYGSPDIKVKKELNAGKHLNSNLSNISSSSNRSSRTPSPTEKGNDHKVIKVKIERPEESGKNISSSPREFRKSRLSRDNSENMTGSSEFMLVLYPDENEKGPSDFYFEEDSIPPPMSLSAPELGNDSPIFNPLKTSASSTELLHERAMNRLYEAAKAEEKELERRRKSIEMKGLNIEIPKIQINSKDQQGKLEYERMHSIKRRLSGGNKTQLFSRRHSQKNTEDFKSDTLNNHANLTHEEKRELMMSRQRSDSEELEEKVFETVRSKMASKKQPSSEKRKISIVDEEKWADDYVSSTEDSSFEEDDEVRKSNRTFTFYDIDEEEQTYHPSELRSMSFSKDDPFEILTKRKQPPSPDFIPKPILKKKEMEDISPVTLSPPTSPKPKRSLSPIPPSLVRRDRSKSLAEASLNLPLLQKTIPEEMPTISSRPRSSSLIPYDEVFLNDDLKPKKPRKRAFSLLPQTELFQKSIAEEKPINTRQRSFSLIPQDEKVQVASPESIYNFDPPKMSLLMQTISAAATISGITAASIVIPDRLVEKQTDAEEAKVVADHYSDIVRNYGTRRSNTSLHKSRDSLQKSQDSLQKSRDSLQKVEERNEEIATMNRYQNNTSTKLPYQGSEKSSSLPSNYHANYLSSRMPQTNLSNKSHTFSSTSSAESGYISSTSPNAYNSPNQGQPTPPGINNENQSSKESIGSYRASPEEPLGLDIAAASTVDTNRASSTSFDNQSRKSSPPLGRQHNRPFSPSLDKQDNRPLSPSLDKSISRPFSPPLEQRNTRRTSESSPTRPLPPSVYKQSSRPFSPTLDQISNRRNSESSPPRPSSRKVSASPMRKPERRKTASPYPKNRRTSPSPMRPEDTSQVPNKRKTSPSPMRSPAKRVEQSPMRIRPPKLKEIMTQTSEGLGSMDENYPEFLRNQKQEELIAKAEVQVHHFVDYLTDLAMFSVACWFYLFSNELFAVPVLLVLAYRQLQVQYRQFQEKFQEKYRQIQDSVSRKIPRWLVRLVQRIKKE